MGAAQVAFVVGIASVNEPDHFGLGGEHSVHVTVQFRLAPSVVHEHYGHHVPLSRMEVILDAVLESLALHLHGRDDEGSAQEVARVAHALARAEAEEEGFESLSIVARVGIDPQPSVERPSVLVRPSAHWWDGYGRLLAAREAEELIRTLPVGHLLKDSQELG